VERLCGELAMEGSMARGQKSLSMRFAFEVVTPGQHDLDPRPKRKTTGVLLHDCYYRVYGRNSARERIV
jgi:hypothetical protein